jgi:hypothetical protein
MSDNEYIPKEKEKAEKVVGTDKSKDNQKSNGSKPSEKKSSPRNYKKLKQF